MRIRRLDLIAYGSFRDRCLEFDADRLQLIYGPNEAGKSTALRALQAVLYGMTEKRDAFLHPWDLMRVGMSIETASGTVNVERRKGRGARSLVYADTERAVSGEEWKRILPVLDQELFLQMFGLDYYRLVEGGHQLSEGQGEIGAALLAAAGDLGGAVEHMRGFQRRAGDLFQNHARAQSKLNVALRRYKEAAVRMRQEKFSSNAYRAAVREMEEKQRECDRLTERIRAGAIEHQRLTRLRQAAPGVALLVQKERELGAMSEAALPEADFAARYERAVQSLRKALTTTENSEAELKQLTERLTDVRRNPELAGRKPAVEGLFSQSGKIAAGRKDRPKLEGERRQLKESAAHNLQLLGLDLDPAECAGLRVRLAQRSEIQRLAEERPRLATRLDESARLMAKIQDASVENRLMLRDLPECPDSTEVERCLAMLATVPTESEMAKLRRQLALAEVSAKADLAALALFRGTGEELRQLQIPLPATARLYQTLFAEQETAEEKLAEEEAKLCSEVTALTRQIRLLENRGAIPTAGNLAERRARRDLGWTAVKSRWLRGTPDDRAEAQFFSDANSPQSLELAYETAVRDADSVADKLRFEAEDVQKKALWLQQLDGLNRQLDEARRKIAEAAEVRRELDDKWHSQWASAGLNPLSPAEMLDWLERRRDIIERLRAAADLRQQVKEIDERTESVGGALRTALQPFGAATEIPRAELATVGRNVLQKANDTRNAKRDLERERKRLQSEQAEVGQRRAGLERQLAEQDRDWAIAIAGLPVPATAKPEMVQQVVSLLDEVAGHSERIQALSYRIASMERDDEEFSAAVREVARQSGAAADGNDALIAIRRLYEAATAASKSEDAARLLEEDIERIRRRVRDAGLHADRERKHLAALCEEAGVEEPELLPASIAQANRRRDLSSQVAEQRRALAGACAGRSFEELIQAVESLELDAVPAQLAGLEERQRELERQKQEAVRRAGELEQEFQTHEAALNLSKAAAEKQSAGAQIVELAEEYLEQEIAARLMSAAIERYRGRHQDPLLERAGEYLARLTCGSFSKLEVEYDDAGRRVLRAVRGRSGEHVDVAGLSDGARDQLFFALRLAYVDDHAVRVGSCPVILDDVLMAFDNERALAALRALSELAKRTQVLLFTHHIHHVELARQGLDASALTVHELTSGSGLAAAGPLQ